MKIAALLDTYTVCDTHQPRISIVRYWQLLPHSFLRVTAHTFHLPPQFDRTLKENAYSIPRNAYAPSSSQVLHSHPCFPYKLLFYGVDLFWGRREREEKLTDFTQTVLILSTQVSLLFAFKAFPLRVR